MPRVFKKHITRYLDADGRRVSRGTTGARKVKQKSGKWYGRIPGTDKPIPLCRNKGAAEIMLSERIKKAELAKAGVVDPHESQRRRPLTEHLADFEASLPARGDTLKQTQQVVARAAKILSGCGFDFTSDLSASRVLEFLASLRENGRPLPPLPGDKSEWTKAELAEALGIPHHAVTGLVRRHTAGDGAGQGTTLPA
jgi:hypothetical protein